MLAPRQPGSYILELDPVFEYVGWFSQRDAEARRLVVEVVPRDPSRRLPKDNPGEAP